MYLSSRSIVTSVVFSAVSSLRRATSADDAWSAGLAGLSVVSGMAGTGAEGSEGGVASAMRRGKDTRGSPKRREMEDLRRRGRMSCVRV